MKWRLKCQEAARLITAQSDRSLGPRERIVLRLHLMACDACPKFQRQVRLISEAMARWRG
ncbi:MAG TPA: zf-HC2 domain-containing protein [Burkholderiaceae bacterium]|jgi:hypothetical protein|nr:zf-HC2 domain-containing protein [Burkholderiaceae bacterium]